LQGRGQQNAIDAPWQQKQPPRASTLRQQTDQHQKIAMPGAEAIRRRFDRINYEEPKTAEDHPWIAAALLFVFVFFFVSVLSTFLNSSAQYQKELAAAEAKKKAKKDE
jgi:hypothetical protein